MGVPKKRTSISKKRIRKNIWKRKGYWAALKAFSLGNLFRPEIQKVFVWDKKFDRKCKRFWCATKN
nr:ribosomal protein L32 [Rhododendron przewalskii subsp. przewalskii]WEG23325.1 ribosomal protein L32 [Rhododendron przewalskii subsp. przewalskii]